MPDPAKPRAVIVMVLLSLILLTLGFGYGFVSHRSQLFPYQLIANVYRLLGSEQLLSTPVVPAAVDATLTDNLAALGYLDAYDPAPERTGVVVHDPELAFEGYNYYVSMHAAEAILMDMSGRVLHTWGKDVVDVFPDAAEENLGRPFRRARLLENGDLFAIFDYTGLIKLDRDSNLIWAVQNGAHHDLDITPDGRVYVLAEERASQGDLRRGQVLREDFIVVLTPEGEELGRVSIVRAFMDHHYTEVFDRVPASSDIFHTNTLEVLDGRLADRSPAFRAGNVLVSLRSVDVIAVIDMDEERVVWAMSGMWKGQHQPTVLENGHMLLFDNQGHYGFSKIIEFDPLAQAGRRHLYEGFDPLQQRVVWSYEGNAENGFVSRTYGSSARLPNGNTLVSQSNSGRVFEVTSDGVVVWEFLNPDTIGENIELIAVIPELVRIELDFPVDWLESRASSRGR